MPLSVQAFLRISGSVPELKHCHSGSRPAQRNREIGLSRHQPLSSIRENLVLAVDQLFSQSIKSTKEALQRLAVTSFSLDILKVSIDFAPERLRLLGMALETTLSFLRGKDAQKDPPESVLELLRELAVSTDDFLSSFRR